MRSLLTTIALVLLFSTANATTAKDCLKSVESARATLLEFKEGKGSEEKVHSSAKEASDCLDQMDAKGKDAKKQDAISAWKAFRKIREDQIVPAIKAGNKPEADKLASDNKANLDKTKNALNSIVGE